MEIYECRNPACAKALTEYDSICPACGCHADHSEACELCYNGGHLGEAPDIDAEIRDGIRDEDGTCTICESTRNEEHSERCANNPIYG